MLKILSGISVASVFAAVLSASASGAAQVATPTSPVIAGKYEIRNADRGATKRIKIFYDGRRIATIGLRRGAASFHCCTMDSCAPVASLNACMGFKVACDADGWCGAG
jgi:hypothetical protein